MKKKNQFQETLEIFAENIAEQIPNPNTLPPVDIIKPKKIDYSLPPEYSMYDTCYCRAKGCKTPCARKKTPHGYVTVSDFTNSCSKYEKEDK